MKIITSFELLESFGFKEVNNKEKLIIINGGGTCSCRSGYDRCPPFNTLPPCIGNCTVLVSNNN